MRCHFGMAAGEKHSSKMLAASDDYRRPVALRLSKFEEDQIYLYEETLAMLQSRLVTVDAANTKWLAADRHDNNIMHLLAKAKAEALCGF